MKIKALRKLGVDRRDVSHWKKNEFKFLSKKKLKIIQVIESNEVINGEGFKSLSGKNFKSELILVLPLWFDKNRRKG